MKDEIVYLNRLGDGPMTHRLLDLIAESKQVKAPVGQWRAWVAGLSQKGVKAAEFSMASLDGYFDAQEQGKALTKSDVVQQAQRGMVTIKEVALGTPYYKNYSYPGGNYREYLYIANSERDCVQDEADEIQWEINDLNFNMDRLMEEPDLLCRLERRLHGLRHMGEKVPDFAEHHYTEAVSGRNGKNLIAHARVSVHESLYFIDEIQSDWAQKGRKADGRNEAGEEITRFDTGHVPKGPYVTSTEEWAGLVLRRHAALAAANPSIKSMAWITGPMRNGGKIVSADNLDEFYTSIIPKIMDKVIGKAGERVRMMDVVLGGKPFRVPGFEMTDKVRARLQEKQAMFSLMRLSPRIGHSDEAKCQVMKQCSDMLGSLAKVRILDRCYDIHTGARVAGKYTNKVLMVSDEAEDLGYSANHETFHAAVDLMLTDRERAMVLDHFGPGTSLNYKVKDELIRSGNLNAAAQCEIAEEAAAHGFALWRDDRLAVDEPEQSGVLQVFRDIKDAMKATNTWIRRNIFGQEYQTPGQIFEALASGALAERRSAELREYHGQS